MTDLSTAAQAVMKAAATSYWDEEYEVASPAVIAAAALRTAVDQVLPKEPIYDGDFRWEVERDARQIARKKLLAIAAELEQS